MTRNKKKIFFIFTKICVNLQKKFDMNLFFADINLNLGEVFLGEEDSFHCVKVLRMQAGDDFLATNGEGLICNCTISVPNAKKVTGKINKSENFSKKQPLVHLVCCPTKNIDRFEFMLEKVTEIGVDEITPLITSHSERKILRLDRCDKVISAAIKQCQIPFKPTLNDLTSFDDFVKKITNNATIFICYCAEEFEKKTLFESLRDCNSEEIIILIGPEGDFSPSEVKRIIAKGGKVVSLSDNRLRTETAGIVAVCIARESL
jgi:16S rRNA (uracil1498-N3)-methyltransferase